MAGPARSTRVLAEGIFFGEGPRWHPDERGGRLWFSDFYSHRILSLGLGGDLVTELQFGEPTSGLGWLPDGSLLFVAMASRRVMRRTADGTVSVHADLSGLATGRCNDMVVDANGNAFVGNFGFDLDAEMRARGPESVIADHPKADLALVRADGSVSVAAPGLSFPNGSVITPDGAALIVGETLGGRLTAFPIGADATLGPPRLWAETWPRVPDGICLDAEGAIWIANPLAPECVRIAEGGAVLEVIETGLPCYACMLGGPEGRHLFMLVAPISDAVEAARVPLGKVLVCEAEAPRAGRP